MLDILGYTTDPDSILEYILRLRNFERRIATLLVIILILINYNFHLVKLSKINYR